jgi:hypothetical protein
MRTTQRNKEGTKITKWMDFAHIRFVIFELLRAFVLIPG